MEDLLSFRESRAGVLVAMSEASLAARPWTQPGYRFRPASQHDQAGHDFRATHPYFGWVQARVGGLDFTMFSSNDDGVAMVYHAFGPDSYESASVAAWVSIAPTCTAVADVGSFTGLFAILAHRSAPNMSVIAVEPNSAVRARLYMNMVANGCYPSVKVAPYAVADAVSTLPLHVAWGPDILDTGSSLHAPSASDVPVRSEIVTAAPIDVLMRQFGVSKIDLMKIDVEGLEEIALEGARETLAAGPTLFLEIQDAKKFVACYHILSKFDYRIMAIDDYAIGLVPYRDGEDVDAWFAANIGARVVNFLCVKRNDHLAFAEAGLARIRALVA